MRVLGLLGLFGLAARAADSGHLPDALELLEEHPLIDGHVDLPFVVRSLGKSPLDTLRKYHDSMPGHIDLNRMLEGRLGGLFMVAWTPCPASHSGPPARYLFTGEGVRDTLEAIDIIKEIVANAPDHFVLCWSSDEVRQAKKEGRIATLIGVEGGHQLGNSLAVVRQYAALGVRYITLTHTCHNVFASSAGSGDAIAPVYPGDGLTPLGIALVEEMNRLGVVVDLSHTSPGTMRDALKVTRAPVMFSHSGARGVYDHPRNVPDDVLDLIGEGEGQVDGVVMAVFYPPFVDPGNATIHRVADHIEYIADKCGRRHVGIGSDFDGIDSAVEGLEDASKYPYLVAEMLRRGWSDSDVVGLLGDNILRILDGADRTAKEMATMPASAAVLESRVDLPCQWGGPGNAYLAKEVQEYLKGHRRDEL
ncbi:hypothetical protein CspeluHIS016_0307670 [Cutaneotrichosporon spelunceum]|uniref:Dipeptidase n=1 Tax=Cutaneotrichosporon spelunceum TaxID=1672016 RepID=A0AAD3TU42_9TREE|nr:hypothetical protein CspeluHIS016_0307670 [Cutaneotrichosporon spelunceum]